MARFPPPESSDLALSRRPTLGRTGLVEVSGHGAEEVRVARRDRPGGERGGRRPSKARDHGLMASDERFDSLGWHPNPEEFH